MDTKQYLDKITDKEIQFNIMIALAKIEGHLGELAVNSATVDYSPLEGGVVNEPSGTNSTN